MDVCALVGRNLRRYRLAAGLSQEEVAARAGMDLSYLSNIERGRRNPSLLMLADLASVFDVKVGDLLDEDEGQSRA